MPFVKGFLNIVSSPGAPDQGLPPGEGPVDPGWGVPEGPQGPVDPGYGFPLPPVTEHPEHPIYLPSPGRPSHPIVIPPTYPVDPGYGLPVKPGIWPQPPHPDNGPPLGPPLLPTHPIYHPDKPSPQPPAGGTPEQPIYLPGHVWPPLPPSVTGTILCFAWIVGVGYRWIVIDADLSAEHPIVIPPPPDTKPEPPGTAEPKR